MDMSEPIGCQCCGLHGDTHEPKLLCCTMLKQVHVLQLSFSGQSDASCYRWQLLPEQPQECRLNYYLIHPCVQTAGDAQLECGTA